MNQINNTFMSSLLIFTAIATGYLSFQKYVDIHYRNEINLENIDKKLIDIQERLQLLQEYKDAEIMTVEALQELEELIDAQENQPQAVIEIDTQDALRSMLQQNKQPAVIFFHMDGCGWCKKMDPVFQQVAHNKNFESIQFYNVNGRSAQAPVVIKELYNESINGYPFLLFIDENGVVGKQSGFSESAQFENAIKSSFKSLFPNFKAASVEQRQAPSGCGQQNQQNEPVIPKPENVIEIDTQDGLRTMFDNNKDNAVIFFHMDGCGWCKKMTPVFYQAAQNKDFADIKFYNVNGRSAQAPAVVKELFDESINGYPFLLFIDQNGFLEKQSGFSQLPEFNNKIKNIFANN